MVPRFAWWQEDAEFSALHSFALHLVGIAWSLSLLEIELPEFSRAISRTLRDLGSHIDCRRLVPPVVVPRREDSRLTRPDSAPLVLVQSAGMMVLSKPTGWEVDGATTDGNLWTAQRMSIFVQGLLPRDAHPINFNADLNYGFIHRLDVLSSGLVLCGTSFVGLYEIQRQLSTHRLARDYDVTVHGLAAPSLSVIDAPVDPAVASREKSRVTDAGKPSLSRVAALAHASACGARYGRVAIRIHTGRRHQIRVHLQHVAHSPAADAGYPTRLVFLGRGPAHGPAPPRADPVLGHVPLEPHIAPRLEGDAGAEMQRRRHFRRASIEGTFRRVPP